MAVDKDKYTKPTELDEIQAYWRHKLNEGVKKKRKSERAREKQKYSKGAPGKTNRQDFRSRQKPIVRKRKPPEHDYSDQSP